MWRVVFMVDPATGHVPARQFLDGLPDKPAAEVVAVLRAVRDAPPPAFSGGGKWQAMHGEMSAFHEVRVRQGRLLHRLFCVLDRSTGTGLIVLVTGGSKQDRTRMDPRMYAAARRLGLLLGEAADAGRVTSLLERG